MAKPIMQDGIVFVAGYGWLEGDQTRRYADKREIDVEDNKNLRGVMSQPLYRNGLCYLLTSPTA